MNPERWQRVKQLFDDTSELDPEERADFLTRECGDDGELRREVESLLASDEEDVTVLDQPVEAIFGAMLPRTASAEGRRFGAYRTVREIGRGGMAVVYSAVRDDDQYEKRVAIKLIKRGMDTDTIVARFKNERQILANLEHPNIARLLDGGVSDDGLPYLVMEQIDGLPIDAYCDRLCLSIEERLRLFRTVCGAVHHAHRNLIVHRDLKPSNILVNEAGNPKLLDFGIAKLVGPEKALGPQMATVVGMRPMTPEYASPEQVRGEAITTASDIYALGVLLFQLLTGHRPYLLKSRTPSEIERVICEEQPSKPSTAIDRDDTLQESAETPTVLTTPAERVSSVREASPQSLRRMLRGDLDNIVLMAMHKDPERRYLSVAQLAADVQRYLDGMPVMARQDTFAYRASKFVRRHRWGVTAVILIFLSLVGGIFATAWQTRVARVERDTANRLAEFLVGLFENNHPDRALGERITVREILDQAAMRIEDELEDPSEVRATFADVLGRAYFELGLFAEAAPLLEEALALRLELFGKDHEGVATSLNNVGELRREQGQYAEAARLHREALALIQRRGVEDLPMEPETRDMLAQALLYQGSLEEAEQELKIALQLWRESFDDKHRDRASTLNNLALVYKSQGQYGRATSLYEEALETSRALGARHPDTATYYNNLGEVYRVQGRCEEAIELYEEALALKSELRGEARAALANTMNNLAGCLKDLKRPAEAERYYRESLELRRETFGEEHPRVADALSNLGSLFYVQGDLSAAKEVYEEALKLNRKLHGDSHPDVAKNLGNLASILMNQGELELAKDYYREALEQDRRLLGEGDPQVATKRHNLAVLLYRMGELDEAEAEARAALRLRREALGDEHRDVAQSLSALGRILFAAERYSEAEPFLREALSLWQKWPDKEWMRVAVGQTILGASLTGLGQQYEEAESLLLAGLEAFRTENGIEHATTQAAIQRVVELYERWGREDRSQIFRRQLLAD